VDALSTIGTAVTGNDALHGKSVISKALSVLEAFTPAAPRLSLKQLAVTTGLPQSTAHRLASELVAWGGLERVDGGGYQIGLRLWEIGALAVRGESVREIALPFMHDLFDAAHETVQLAILDGTQAVYIEQVTGPGAVPTVPCPGGRLPLNATGAGKVLLAYGSDDLLAAVLAKELTRYTAHTIVVPGQLRRALTKVRREGVAFANQEMSMGSVSVASPLLTAGGSAIAALEVVVGTDRSDLRRLATAVQATANSVSRILQQAGGDDRSRAAGPSQDR
jgi:DNA-binding IclR family transcriptional regulator